jgi:hypothetical protein
LEFCFENNIIFCCLPFYTSYKLQLCNIAVFALLKVAYCKQVNRLEQGSINTIGKQYFTSFFSPAREKVFIPKNIKTGFAVSSLFLFNLNRVLRYIPKSLTNLTIPKANKVKVGSCLQNIVLQIPVTPVSAEGFILL